MSHEAKTQDWAIDVSPERAAKIRDHLKATWTPINEEDTFREAIVGELKTEIISRMFSEAKVLDPAKTYMITIVPHIFYDEATELVCQVQVVAHEIDMTYKGPQHSFCTVLDKTMQHRHTQTLVIRGETVADPCHYCRNMLICTANGATQSPKFEWFNHELDYNEEDTASETTEEQN